MAKPTTVTAPFDENNSQRAFIGYGTNGAGFGVYEGSKTKGLFGFETDDHAGYGVTLRRLVYVPLIALTSFMGVKKAAPYVAQGADYVTNVTVSAKNSVVGWFSSSNKPKDAEKADAVQRYAEMAYNASIKYGDYDKVDEIMDEGNSYEEMKKVVASVMGKDTLTTSQIAAQRKDDKILYDSVRNAAVGLVRDEYMGLVSKKRREKDHFGNREIHPVTKEHDVMHWGQDVGGFRAHDPVYNKDTLIYEGANYTGLKTVTYKKTNGHTIPLLHSYKPYDADFHKGDTIWPHTMIARIAPKDAYSTAPHLHVEEIDEKGEHVDPYETALQFIDGLAPSKKYRQLDKFVAEKLSEGRTFKDIKEISYEIDAARASGKIGKSRAKKLHKQYDEIIARVNEKSNKLIVETVHNDKREIAAIFDETVAVGMPEDAAPVTVSEKEAAKRKKEIAKEAKKEDKESVKSAKKAEKIEKEEAKTGKVSSTKTYGKYNPVPASLVREMIIEDKGWQSVANRLGRDVEDVADTYLKVVNKESGFDPTVKAKDLVYKDKKTGEWVTVKRSAEGLFGATKKPRNNAAKQIGKKWPSKDKLGTIQGMKDQISIMAQFGHNLLDDIALAKKGKQNPNRQNIDDRVYMHWNPKTARYEPRYESELSSLVNSWGPGAGGYVALRAKEVDVAEAKDKLPVFRNKVYASGQWQDFSRYAGFVESTPEEKIIESRYPVIKGAPPAGEKVSKKKKIAEVKVEASDNKKEVTAPVLQTVDEGSRELKSTRIMTKALSNFAPAADTLRGKTVTISLN